MEKEELPIEDRMILIEDQVNYALSKINELEKNIAQLTKDSTEHYSKLIQLENDTTEINENVFQLGEDFFNTDKELREKIEKQRLEVSGMQSQIYTLDKQNASMRELINALFDALNILVESINSIRDRKE
ncbi:MAG: hypothetical protein QXP36_07915 [Conexivisphaerales archaeon]